METSIALKRLEEMRDDLDRSISILQGEHPGPVAGAGYPQDSADAGSSLSEADRTEAVLLSARTQRDGVLAALARIQDNSYGRCVDCGRQIPEGRLEARPDAARCVDCQAKYAKRLR
ncbi:MAG TPA: TraR/DksA family transcriptional regulator [Streptosporangiaceae bacterium]|nr:TraR/DksA family transcriptional regulator [Streptosporangiaceae bacterium]HEX2823706.1 TraR/DksA family transcriptional regulator [Streptosporangiaceae bacterium]